MGHQATSELVALSPEGQIACIAIALNKLARVANVPSTDLNAINQFTYDVLSTLSPVAQGKKTYIMIGINLANADSVPAYSTIYIDLDEFIKSPQQMMANLNEALVEMGINSLTSVTISLTSQPLMSSLVGSEERMMLASSNLEDSSALIVSPPLSWVPGHFYEKEVSLTPIQPVNVENALEVITRLKVNIARIFTHHQNGQYFEASDSVGSPLLYILADDDEEEEELRNNVPLIRTSSQEDLEQEQEIEMRQNKPQLFSPLVGLDSKEKPIAPSTAELVFESPMPESQQVLQPGTPQDQALTLADGVNGVAFDPSNSVSLEEQSVAIVAIRTSGLESGVAPTSDFAETTVGMMGYTGVAREVHSPGPSITPLVNGDLIRQFKLGVDRLEQLNKVLMEKYCYDQEKRYIIITNQLLIEELNTALNNYEKPGTALRGDLKQFKTACLKAVNDKVKEQYNRHRDGPIGQFFGFIAEALSNFWAQLFSSAEECQKRTEVQAEEHRFFGTEAMVTRSAKALNLFNMEMTAAFKLVQADDDLEDRAQLGVVE